MNLTQALADLKELPLPATYFVGEDGVIRDAFVDPDYYHRKDPRELLEALEPSAATAISSLSARQAA